MDDSLSMGSTAGPESKYLAPGATSHYWASTQKFRGLLPINLRCSPDAYKHPAAGTGLKYLRRRSVFSLSR